jgi:UDP-hydrolysing UDP-N-acetyl-D-glucosamine 2-epimerase
MRTIGVVTGGRADYGLLLPVIRRIRRESALELRLYVTGMHLAVEYGNTVQAIEAEGLPIAARVDIELASDAPHGIARSMSLALAGFAGVFAQSRPDVLLVLGDRFEIFAAVAAAVPFNIPVAHIAGGEVTEGAIDDVLRHAITKMSHLHFVAAEPYRQRVIQMGEEAWRVHATGEPGLDHICDMTFQSRDQLEALVGMPLANAPLLVTFHPETLDPANTAARIAAVLSALARVSHPIIFTAPNADTSGRAVRAAIEQFVAEHRNARLVLNLGTQAYFSAMRIAAAMVGNSSSGIVEAGSFELPVVNVGERQRGRLRGANVIDVPAEAAAIEAGLARALDPRFRAGLRGMTNVYGDGHASEKIVQVLKDAPPAAVLLQKRFHDAQAADARGKG